MIMRSGTTGSRQYFAAIGGMVLLAVLASSGSSAEVNDNLIPQNLRCEWRVNPLGIDAVRPHFSWTLRSSDARRRGAKQAAYQILVSFPAPGKGGNAAQAWDSGKVSSSQIVQIEYAGSALASATRYFWKLRVWDEHGLPSAWTASNEFSTGLLGPDRWKASWIAAEKDRPVQPPAVENRGTVARSMRPLPIFRHEFAVQKKVHCAFIFVSGLGHYELHINGKNVTDTVLAPGWTNYRKRVFYNTYDVSELLKYGRNAIGVMLGNGMYNVPGIKGRYTKFIGSFGQPKLILELHLRYLDGTDQIVASDSSWKTSNGPIVFTTIYGGEDYDARREQPGWDMPAFHGAGWKSALKVKGPGGELIAEQSPPIKVMHSYLPGNVTHPKPDVTIYDLGQNFSGWPEISVRGRRGAKLKLVAGELLDPSGLVSQHSANASPGFKNSFSYTLRGGGNETWHPRFTYYGFRYLQVEGANPTEAETADKPTVVSCTGHFIHDDVDTVGTFESSSELFGRVHRLINMAVLSNMVSVLTDCPQREKLGWLEQTYLAGSSILMNYDAISLYKKMALDIHDSQLVNGMVPGIAPEYVAFLDRNGASTMFRDSPEWGSAAILSPWTAYQFYGDRDLLASQYDSMRSYSAYLGNRAKDYILDYGLGDWYDIGPGPPGVSQLTGKEVTATAVYYQDLVVLSKIAALLNKPRDAEHYAVEAASVRDAFNVKLFHAETGQYDRGSQTANAVPLALGMVPTGQENVVLQHLIDDIYAHGNHVTAGDIGFHYVVRALTDAGRSDVLYDMLSRMDSPSYGYQLLRGATTLTEAWDANPDSSQNHFMLGHGEEWFYRGLAGISIDFDRPEAERISIRPYPVAGIESASATYRSVMGEIRSAWVRNNDDLVLKIAVPPNSMATVEIPTSAADSIREGDHTLDQDQGVLERHRSGRGLVVLLDSGNYEFSSKL